MGTNSTAWRKGLFTLCEIEVNLTGGIKGLFKGYEIEANHTIGLKGLFTPSVSINAARSLIENSEVSPEWGGNPFSSDSIVFNENVIANVIIDLPQC